MERNEDYRESKITIKTSTGIIFVLLAVLMAVGVGLIVHFAENRELKCSLDGFAVTGNPEAIYGTDPDPSKIASQCMTWAGENNDRVCELCSNVSTTTTSSLVLTSIANLTVQKTNFRIPRNLLPNSYNIEIKPNMYGNPEEFTFSGTVHINLNCTSPTRSIVMNIYRLNISADSVRFGLAGRTGGGPQYVSHIIDDVLQTLTVNLSADTEAGLSYVIQISFSGKLEHSDSGFTLRSTKHENNTAHIAFTHFEPYSARKAFPCFDEPDMKATFQITLVRQNGISTLSNMPKHRQENREDGFVADIYFETVIMPTYLVAYVFGNLRSVVKTTSNGVRIGVWASPELIAHGKEALTIGERALDMFESYFDVRYPLPKLDLVAVHDFRQQGMENWGLNIYDEHALLYNPSVPSQKHLEYINNVIAHELAHQWFGNLVTMRWWDDLWLNEGFATFMGVFGVEQLNPGKNLFSKYMLQRIKWAFDFDSKSTSHPVCIPIRKMSDINRAFGVIAYSKGAAIIRMMRFFLGEETFRNGISSYLKLFKYRNADRDDLWYALGNQSMVEGHSIDVKGIMDTWILQMNHPVVTVTRTTSTRITLHQRRFLLNKNMNIYPADYISPFNYQWKIPFTFTTDDERKFNKTRQDIYWLDEAELAIEIPLASTSVRDDEWIIGNVGRLGFYRVNYERNNWQALIAQLKRDHQVIPYANRVQIIDDLMALTRAGDVELDLALECLEYIPVEKRLLPWQELSKQIHFLDLVLSRSDLYRQYKALWQMKLTEAYRSFSGDLSDGSGVDVSVRSLVIENACRYGVPACVKNVQNLLQTWMNRPLENRIDPDLRSAVYCSAVEAGGVAEWNFLYSQYKQPSMETESGILLNALGCSQDTWILNRYLKLTVDSQSIDISNVIKAVCQSREGQRITAEFVMSNWEYFAEQIKTNVISLNSILQFVVKYFNTPDELQQMQVFVTMLGGQETNSTVIHQAVEKIESNINFMSKSYDTIKKWLSKTLSVSKNVGINMRLPRTMKPFLYQVEIKPNVYECDPVDCTFDGHVKIYMTCLQPIDIITMHMNGLVIEDRTIRFGSEDENNTAPYYSHYTVDSARQFLVLHLGSRLAVGQNYWVKMNFSGPLKDDMTGLYLSSYKRDNKTIYLATTQFQPTDARKAFPCFDEPDLKAKFQITLVRKPPMISLSNMPIALSQPRENGLIADIYNTTLDMSTYLLDFTVGEFLCLENTTRKGIQYRVWARPEIVQHTQEALRVGIKTMDYYEDYFNVSFPLPKQDMVAVPDLSFKAMENWGLVSYRESVLLYDSDITSLTHYQQMVLIITHELAHMWFGDLVTMKWWDDLWLNEGFATYMMYVGGDHVFTDWRMMDQFTTSVMSKAFQDDSLVTSHPIYVPVSSPSQINEVFDNISYMKGASIVRMMANFLGELSFRYGLKNYFETLKYGNAFHDDLWHALSDQAKMDGVGIDVKEVMETWILQMNYPVVMVTRLTNGSLLLSQKRFKKDPDSIDPKIYESQFGYTWKIPITFTTSQNPNFTSDHIYWLTTQNKVLEEYSVPPLGNKGWIIGNLKLFGFYRVNYDESNWRAIISELHTNHEVIHPINRLQIISDTFSLGISGDIDMVLALETIGYLVKEMDYIPWDEALRQLNYLNVMLSQTEIYGQFQVFVKHILEKPYQTLLTKHEKTHTDKLLYAKLEKAACGYGISQCVTQARRLYRRFRLKPSVNRIVAESRRTVLCTEIANGGLEEWEFVYAQYQLATDAVTSLDFLVALTCSKESWILTKLLHLTINPKEISRQHAVTIIVETSRNLVGRQLAWQFLTANWELFIAEYGGNSFLFPQSVQGITDSFNSMSDIKQLEDFLGSHTDFGAADRLMKQALESARSNMKFMDRNFKTMKQWLLKVTSSFDDDQEIDMRLPRSLKPEMYDLEIQPDIYDDDPGNFTLSGSIHITIKCVSSSKNITLHVLNLVINESSVIVKTVDGAVFTKVQHLTYLPQQQFVVIFLAKELTPGSAYHISMDFTGQLNDNFWGLYYSHFYSGNNTNYLAVTRFESPQARRVFPCFDEPEFKAPFQISVVRKSGKHSLSNMNKISTRTRSSGWVVDVFNTSLPMSAHLVAFAVTDFGNVTKQTKHDVQFTIFARPDSLSQTKVALDAGSQILDWFEEYFEIRYPLPKQDLIAIPDMGPTAMENWGLVTFRESALLFHPNISSFLDLTNIATVVAHELAHQWFCNLVTMKWWNDLWLNEGFADFMAYVSLDKLYPQWHMMQTFTVRELHVALAADSVALSHPISVTVHSPTDFRTRYKGEIFYNKGSSVLRMLQFILGEDAFKKGITSYLRKKAFGSSTQQDLWASFTNASDTLDVGSIMDTWTLQMNYPVVMVTYNSPGMIVVTQSRFLQNDAKDPGKYVSPYGYIWKVPFTYTTSLERHFNKTHNSIDWCDTQMCRINSSQIPDPNEQTSWILGNLQQYGFYRVNYTNNNWQALTRQLLTNYDVIPPINRAQIINDAWSLARVNQLDITVALQTFQYLSNELDYAPWAAAKKEILYLDKLLKHYSIYGKFQDYILSLIDMPMIRSGIRNGTNDLNSFLTFELLEVACHYGDKQCVSLSVELFRNWTKQPSSNPILPGFRLATYCTAIKYGGEREWDFLLSQYEKSSVSTEKNLCLRSLACSSQEWQLTKLLDMAVAHKVVRKQDFLLVINGIVDNPRGERIAWDYIRTNSRHIAREFGESRTLSFLINVAKCFHTDIQLAELQLFGEDNPDMSTGSSSRRFTEAYHEMETNNQFIRNNFVAIEKWLIQRNNA